MISKIADEIKERERLGVPEPGAVSRSENVSVQQVDDGGENKDDNK